MKYKLHSEVKDIFPLANLLSEDCIKNLNRLFGTVLTKKLLRAKINLPAESEFKFYKKIMEQVPGFDRKE